MSEYTICATVVLIFIIHLSQVILGFTLSHPTIVSREFERIQCIKPDIYRSGMLLMCAPGCVMEFNITSGNHSLIAGDIEQDGYIEGNGTAARFDYVLDLVQTNQDIFMVSDSNGCVRWINNTRTSPLAGNCTNYGFQDGSFSEADFVIPYGLLLQNNSLFVCDHYNDALRLVDLHSETVSTLIRGGHGSRDFKRPSQIACNSPQCSDLYISFQHGVIRYNKLSNTTEIIAGGTKPDFGINGLIKPEAIIFLTNEILIVCNSLVRSGLHSVNISSHEVKSLVYERLYFGSYSVLCYNNSLYVSADQVLYKHEINNISEGLICYDPEEGYSTTPTSELTTTSAVTPTAVLTTLTIELTTPPAVTPTIELTTSATPPTTMPAATPTIELTTSATPPTTTSTVTPKIDLTTTSAAPPTTVLTTPIIELTTPSAASPTIKHTNTSAVTPTMVLTTSTNISSKIQTLTPSAILGIAVAGVVLLAIVIAIPVAIWFRRKASYVSNYSSSELTPQDNGTSMKQIGLDESKQAYTMMEEEGVTDDI